MEFGVTSKGKGQIVFEEHSYNKTNILKNNVISWEYVNRHNERK